MANSPIKAKLRPLFILFLAPLLAGATASFARADGVCDGLDGTYRIPLRKAHWLYGYDEYFAEIGIPKNSKNLTVKYNYYGLPGEVTSELNGETLRLAVVYRVKEAITSSGSAAMGDLNFFSRMVTEQISHFSVFETAITPNPDSALQVRVLECAKSRSDDALLAASDKYLGLMDHLKTIDGILAGGQRNPSADALRDRKISSARGKMIDTLGADAVARMSDDTILAQDSVPTLKANFGK